MSPTYAWAIVSGLGLGFGLWLLVSMAPRMNRPRLARRVAPYLLDLSAGAREAVAPPPPGPLPVLGVMAGPVASRARRLLARLLGGDEQIRRRLRQSGSSLDVETFRARQLAWGVGGGLIGGVVAVVAVGTRSTPLPLAVVIVVLCAAAGVLLRDYVLQRAARSWLARLAEELPVVLEFLTLSLSAGEGILDALRRVGRVGGGELARELAGVVTSVGTGLPLAQTLQALDRDLELPPFSRCVEQIVGALERGTPLAEVLRAQAQDSRDDAKRGLLEVAGRKEVAMMFPLVFLILPITITFAIFPGLVVLQVGL